MFIKECTEAKIILRSFPPLSAEHTIESRRNFILNEEVDFRSILLHAVLVDTMNKVMGHDESAELQMRLLDCTRIGTTLELHNRTEYMYDFQYYKLQRRTGEKFSSFLLTDHTVALFF